MSMTGGSELVRIIQCGIRDVAEVEIYEDNGRHGERVVVRIQRSGGGRPIYLAMMHPGISNLTLKTIGAYMVEDYEGFVAT